MLKTLENFSSKVVEISLLVEQTAQAGAGADAMLDDSAYSIKLKSFEQQAQANIITGGAQSLAQPLLTESTIPIMLLEQYSVRAKSAHAFELASPSFASDEPFFSSPFCDFCVCLPSSLTLTSR